MTVTLIIYELSHYTNINNINVICSLVGGLKFCFVPSQSTHINVIKRPGLGFFFSKLDL